MKAVQLEAVGRLSITTIDRPRLTAPDQILVQTKAVGICGSEVHAFEGTHPYRTPPCILGHEAAGVVVEVGEQVTRVRVGDRVIVDPQWPCGACIFCRNGDINLCPHKKVLGTPAWPGAFAEYFVAPEASVFPLPDHFSFVQGALIEPLTVGVHVARRAGLSPGQSAVILGSGSIGGLLAGVCHARGADPVIVADIRQHCLDAARERLGATHDILLPNGRVVDEVRSLTQGEGADVVFVTADEGELVHQAVEMAKPRGVIVLVALLTAAPLSLRAYDIIGKERHLIGSSMSNHQDVEEAIALAAEARVDVEGIVTHILPIDEAQRGMELAATKADGAIKVVLTYP
ncbi:MAG: alcohol dehydrogenase [Caldilineae bacterium]|nr:MAG: alcohol dehydrogenase [Caldilineae bacterium]